MMCLVFVVGLDLVTEFLLFQDSMEEAIAQATVLPRVLSLPLYLEPAQRRRGAIVQKLSQAIETVWAQEDQGLGVWLGEIRRNNRRLRKRADGDAAESQDHGGSAAYQREFSATEAAELCCGLLFASHKNPSLAATQTLLFMLEQHGRDPKDSVLDLASVEARGKQVGEGSDLDMRVIHNCIYDTLRLTAHVIGSIRKVVDPRGFTVTITDAGSVGDVKAVQEGQVVSYTLPCGSYIGESHFVPNWLSAPERDGGTDVSMPVFELDYMRVQRDSAREFENDYEFTTFSHGVHKCAGQHLAVMVGIVFSGGACIL
jgi:cytochrome P450